MRIPKTVDQKKLRLGRLARLRAELARQECAACVLTDPVNVRYACGTRNMQVFLLRNPARYLFVPVEGPVVLFEFEGCHHLASHLETVDEIRPNTTVSFVAAGPNLRDAANHWAAEIGDLVRTHGGGNKRVGIERFNYYAAAALAAQGFEVVDAQDAVERARSIKTPHEVAAMREGMAVVADAVAVLSGSIEPGQKENEIWAVLHREVIANDADYVETRLLASGPRTNPWFQESGTRVVRRGDLVTLDTDTLGPHGYYVDFSRTFLAGDGKASGRQRTLYGLAREQVEHNMALIRPGLTFGEFTEKAWKIPDDYVANRYYLLAHGIGMTGEYPYILHPIDYAEHGYDGVIEPGMVLCVESYIGADGGPEGVKLEQQVLVTETGIELMSHFPFDDRLSA